MFFTFQPAGIHSACKFSIENQPRGSWVVFIEDVSTGVYLPHANITILSIIDLKPSYDSCIYSTLSFLKSQAEQLHIPTQDMTFD